MTTVTMLDLEALKKVHEVATTEAAKMTQQYINAHGENFPCGFAWVSIPSDGRTKLGRLLKEAGMYGKIWNPSNSRTQDMYAKEAGAEAYVSVLHANGINAYVQTRMD